MNDYLNPHHIYPDALNQPDLNLRVPYYDTKPADECPVCGGMFFPGEPCECCGYDGEARPDKPGKDAIIRHCLRKLTPDDKEESDDEPER